MSTPEVATRQGEACVAGTTLVPRGTPTSPTVLGLAASVGYDTVTVHRRPRVRVLLTGDEVVRRGLPRPGSLRDAVGPMLPGLVSSTGGLLTGTESLPDDHGALYDALAGSESDVIAVCGASSAGPTDHLAAVLTALGARTLVQGVACRPGHPQTLAQLPDGRWVVGLPGNPFAALVATTTLLAPLLARSAGRPAHRKQWARLHGIFQPHPIDTRLVAVAWTDSTARPVGHDNSATLWGPALTDALAVVPAGWDGEAVELLHLPT